MNDRRADLAALDAAFASLGYPKELTEEYDQLECLSGRRGRETFLLRRRSDGLFAVAKCYERALFPQLSAERDALDGLDVPGIPRALGRCVGEKYVCILREYIPGTALSELVRERELSQREITELCLQLCRILDALHSLPEPVIHRDIKPENLILGEDGRLWLIDFDIARTFKPDAASDTVFFGTRGYAAPEQYGFAQTDARADIYSFGVLLRFLLTGSIRKSPHVRLYRPLSRIIDRCTAFAPEKRFGSIRAVEKALRRADPRTHALCTAGMCLGALILCALLVFGGVKLYRHLTYSPFGPDSVPSFVNDAERVSDAVSYLKTKYGTHLFDAPDNVATVGDLRAALMELYGLERDYVYRVNTSYPQESPDFFLPWGWDDGQTLDRDPAIYAAVKVHDPAIVADWSRLKDDNGFYPGVRVAMDFAEETGISAGANQPLDISVGELAIIFANADRVFDAAKN